MKYSRPTVSGPPRRLGLVDYAGQEALVGLELNGRYRIGAVIAHGGMATVYHALDLRLGREIAVKIMNPDPSNTERDLARFVREAQSAASLNHPGIVQVFDQGQQDRIIYLAMEYVPGRTLRAELTEQGSLSPGRALDLVEQILAALAMAHGSGLVHRDIKPENVLITPQGQVKVADFGLARLVGPTQQTQATGAMFGTVAYLSPEQAERGHADARSDVYALGIVLFEMLTGTPPFSGDTAVNIALQHVTSRVPAPSLRQPGLHPELDRLVQWATARRPQERPATAGEFLAAVQQVRAIPATATLDPARAAASSRLRQGPDRNAATTMINLVDVHPTRTFTPLHPTATPQAAEPGGRPRGPGRGRWVVAIIAMVAIVLAGAGWYLGAGPGRRISVPGLVNWEQARAEATLRDRGLTPKASSSFSSDIAPGRVISSKPAAGSRIGPGTVITLVISRGPERTKVPDVLGQTEPNAREILSKARLNIGQINRIYSDTVPVGEVLASGPDSGTAVNVAAEISLDVSKGPEPVQIKSWVRKPAVEAIANLEDLGLRPAVSESFSDDVPLGQVIRQEPAGGSAPRGTAITVVVSKGSEFVRVPSVLGRSVTKAREILQKSGLQMQENAIFSGRIKAVVAQDPIPGSKVRRGSTVRVALP